MWNSKIQKVPCLRCDTQFERKRRGPVSHYCQPCRRDRKREYDREYRLRADEAITELRTRLPDEIAVYLDDYRDVLDLDENETLPVAHDRMPPGSKSQLGSDDGRSTFFRDLAGRLDYLASEVTKHTCQDPEDPRDCPRCFWDENPHWTHDLSKPV
jgi:hypothetical protein